MMGTFINMWPIWLPVLIVFSMHAYERTKSGVGYIYPKDLKVLMRRRINIFSFQSRDSYEACHIKGAIHVDITEIDPDALLLLIEKRYPIFCYCDDGTQSMRYFTKLQEQQKAFWLVGGLHGAGNELDKYCIKREIE